MSLKLKLDRLQRLCFSRSPVKIPNFYECISASLCFVVLYSLRLLTLCNSFWIVKRYMVCLIAEDECQLCRLSLYPIICHFIFLRYKYLQWFDKKRVKLTLTELVLLYILTDFKLCRVEMKLYLNLVAVTTHLRLLKRSKSMKGNRFKEFHGRWKGKFSRYSEVQRKS
jgi:hypothetical protein